MKTVLFQIVELTVTVTSTCLAFCLDSRSGGYTLHCSFVWRHLWRGFQLSVLNQTNIISLANQNRGKQPNEPISSRLEANCTCIRRVVLVLLIGRESGARFFSHLLNIAVQCQRNVILLLNWKPLCKCSITVYVVASKHFCTHLQFFN